MLECKNKKIFQKILQISLKKVFVIKKVKNTAPLTYIINDLNGQEVIGTFYDKELQKTRI